VRSERPCSNRVRGSGSWCARFAPYDGAGFHVVLEGGCRLLPDGGAPEAGVSRPTLARRFTALVGRPPMAYLTWWRLTIAATLLRDTSDPLAAIARRVGYGSPYAFPHAFSREFGTTPGRYRADPQGDRPAHRS
jgi:Helix-turn-helix domain